MLVTGHTGFKGAWLTMMLRAEGHTVSGLALDPEPGSLYEQARVGELVAEDLRVDIRDAQRTADAIRSARPDVVVHLAAQALVRESYRDPRYTIETNVLGTLNVLEAVAATPSVKAHLVATTDKVYQNVSRREGYRESDALGAADPYSTSKAMADLLTQTWVSSVDGPPTAVVRAGNVIGGGDVSRDRLLPDLLRAFQRGEPARLRFPDAVRPWQHVLDCLSGYRAIVTALLAGEGRGEWNIGPDEESFVTVGDVATTAAQVWGDSASWTTDDREHPHEAGLLALDATRARTELGWRDALTYPECLVWTVEWQRRACAGEDPRRVTMDQITAHVERSTA
ncbi:CDP-glucose 4,6-dehydratase [Microbacterium sp.]|uniref:CDP-glucose 4,6-dehydratase n=1 Tax=Microbacterium sp. TaxID=51671 RepID=UPI002D7764C0|nr:CDP-glucose 4,6-dehydratase [Microbacterium sp.]